MGRLYSVSLDQASITSAGGARDIFEILAPADMCLKLHEIRFTQSTEAGDAEAEQLRFSLKRASGSYTSGSGGSTPTPAPLTFGDAASTVTAEANNTTQASAGTGALTTLMSWAENVQLGLHYLPTPETQIIFSPSQAIVFSIDAGPTDDLTANAFIIFEEIGG